MTNYLAHLFLTFYNVLNGSEIKYGLFIYNLDNSRK